ncbi:hypothetical protein IWZ00DRAFT_72471 [Phyllosticta capitalensis]|uniref:BTB domain-containing protein n=1 Tax=Phyllosticta capitalensis TaxID=121624 RepID=A0ABR1YJY9_9PEZI
MMETDEPPSLESVVGDLLVSGLFSDFQVRCSDGTVYNLHRSMVCSQSDFFRKAFSPNFQEAKSGIVNLESDDPAILKALFEYFYHHKYTDIDTDAKGLLIFHTNVYAAGEMYRVQGMKNLAMQRFRNVVDQAATLDGLDFPLAVNAVYKTTIPSDKGMRGVVIDIAKTKINEIMALNGMDEMMDAVGQFGKDLSRAMLNDYNKMRIARQHGCPKCNKLFFMEIPTGLESIYCPGCCEKSEAADWKQKMTNEVPPPSQFQCCLCSKVVLMYLPGGRYDHTGCVHCGKFYSNSSWFTNKVVSN